ncbi:MAG: ice-binding family protein [Dehalococcoidia bacterium]|nr:ice-binding family protein [Dehalococcoidia bacterium]
MLTLTVVSLLAYGGKVTSGYFSDGESSTDNVLRVKIAPLFGSADSFAVLAGSGITNTGATTITGDIGSFPTYTVPGGSITLNGTNHADDAVTQGAKNDLVIAYNDAAGRTPDHDVGTELGGTSPVPGVYYNSVAGTFGITGNLTLTGDANAVWIFQAASTLITATGSEVILSGGAKASNVYWVVGSSATLGGEGGAGSILKGNILALTSATLNTGTNMEGRVLARNGAVTLHASTIIKPTP